MPSFEPKPRDLLYEHQGDRPAASGSLAETPPVPKYYQLRTELERQIASGGFPPGTFLPPERELFHRYGVSRTTLREALRPLLLAGTLVSLRGKGIQVARPTIRQAGNFLVSFTDVLRSQGLAPGIEAVRVAVGTPPEEVKEALRLPPRTRVVRVERVRTADRQPINFSISYLPVADVPGITAEELRQRGSLYLLLKSKFECIIARAEDEMWARKATRREASLLSVRAGDPVLVLRRVSFLHDGHPVEYALSVMRSDIYRYVVRLMPPALTPAPRPGILKG